ncbi:hypothetical protein [Chondromyces apiculatus]|uniref:Response regulator receiver domain protein (CheY-like) n=1 Tax=Chondromyces apiculatus DSM 436 TaxID=1192034 RepID=A0A017SZL5_9BACT|nr:hypothetical protein [Chondromyces apiculatus]EYF02202.1 response regulator receiver domain protein (CheY-like) [Chondromyces apiculatus DSM 436]
MSPIPSSKTEVNTSADDEAPETLRPEARLRRARLRRLVTGIVALTGVLAILAVGKTWLRSRGGPSTREPAMAAPEAGLASASAVTSAEPAPPAAVPPATPAPAPTAQAEAAPSAEATAQAPAGAPTPDPAEAKRLQKEALSLLNRGKNKEAVEAARAAIAADPTDAMSYLYLGSALQDSGKWKEGIAAYSDCVRTAKTGPVHECSAMGGRK